MCTFHAGQWISTQNDYRLTTDPEFSHPEKLDLVFFQQSSNWKLQEPVTYRAKEEIFYAKSYNYTYDRLEYTLHLERHPTYYIIVILVPTILMGLISVLALILPPESGEKVSLAITVLLSQILELLVLSEILPASGEKDFPLIGVYVIFQIMMVALSVIECVLIAKIHFNADQGKPAPKWLLTLISEEKNEVSSRLNQMDQITRVETAEQTESNGDDEAQMNSKAASLAWSRMANIIDRVFLIGYASFLLIGFLAFLIIVITEIK